jgi:hypothetical protein
MPTMSTDVHWNNVKTRASEFDELLNRADKKFKELEKVYNENTDILATEVSAIERRTKKNNNRKTRFHAGKTATAGCSVLLFVASGGVYVLAVGGWIVVAGLNRLRKEQQYQEKVKRSLDKCNEVVITERVLIEEYIQAVGSAKESLQQLCNTASHLTQDDDVAQQNLSTLIGVTLSPLAMASPLLKYYIRQTAPQALGQAAVYFVLAHPETSANAAITVLPAIISAVNFLGVDLVTGTLSIAIDCLPFVNLFMNGAQLSKVRREAIIIADEANQIRIKLMENRETNLQQLKNLIYPPKED